MKGITDTIVHPGILEEINAEVITDLEVLHCLPDGELVSNYEHKMGLRC